MAAGQLWSRGSSLYIVSTVWLSAEEVEVEAEVLVRIWRFCFGKRHAGFEDCL
jgi:hypothetical protein